MTGKPRGERRGGHDRLLAPTAHHLCLRRVRRARHRHEKPTDLPAVGVPGGETEASEREGERKGEGEEGGEEGIGMTRQNRNVPRQSRGLATSRGGGVPLPTREPDKTLLEAETALICPRCGIQGHHRTWEACARALRGLRAGRP
jgi:hypothetical protein